MSLLQSNDYFSETTTLNIGRSRIPMSHTHKTTFDAGELVPIFYEEVLPGDTFNMQMQSLCRMSTPIFPVMDNAYLETFFFFVPNRLVWEHWKQFCGENTNGPWVPTTEYTIPQLKCPTKGWDACSLADYFGIPTLVDFSCGGEKMDGFKEDGFGISQLPFRAYSLIWNEWFRDQNSQSPVYVPFDDSLRQGKRKDEAGIDTVSDNAYLGGKLLPVYKFHDYFTSALPSPQKGAAVSIPMVPDVPVVTMDKKGSVRYYDSSMPGLRVSSKNDLVNGKGYQLVAFGDGTPNSEIRSYMGSVTSATATVPVQLTNLYADTSSAGGTINALRQAFQIQKFFENDARSGTRYRELLTGHFGVTSPDSRMQVPEFLGGTKTLINVDSIVATNDESNTDFVRSLGNVGAYSVTNTSGDLFNKSFTEHGMIIGLACVRYDHSYQQGVDRRWTRERRFDYYWPEFANIGEQAILERELYVQNPDVNFPKNKAAFGYQEAWAEYRYHPNRVSGLFRSNYRSSGTSNNTSLDSWHYADNYSTMPILSAGWLKETKANVARTLAVQDEPQFIADFYFKADAIRPLPVYSIPGLADHH